jgi:hypothetical protein
MRKIEQFIDFAKVSEGSIKEVRFTNIIDTIIVLLTTDGQLVYVKRGITQSVTGGQYSALDENIHPTKDECLVPQDRRGTPDPFRTVIRGIEEEVSPELAREIDPATVLLLGVAFNIDCFHPDLLFTVAVPYRFEQIVRRAEEFPGKDYFEGKLLSMRASRDDTDVRAVLSLNNWDGCGKAGVMRTLEFLDAVKKRHRIEDVELLLRMLAAGDTAWI